jgi:hypothetical protein
MNNLALSPSSSESESLVDQNNNKLVMDKAMNDAFSLWKQTLNIINPNPPVIQFDANLSYFQPFYLNVFHKEEFFTDKNNNQKTLKKYAVDIDLIHDET